MKKVAATDLFEFHHGQCPYCGLIVGNNLSRHMGPCSEIPSAADLAKILDDNPAMSLADLAKSLNKTPKIVQRKLLMGNTNWTKVRLRERSKDVLSIKASEMAGKRTGKRPRKVYDGPRCPECGLVMDKKKLCKFCEAEKVGIKTWLDYVGAAENHPGRLLLG